MMGHLFRGLVLLALVLMLVLALLSAGSPHVIAQMQDRETCKNASGQIALDACTRAIKANRFDAESIYYRGVEWANNGDFDKAIADYRKAIEINPRDAFSFNNKGISSTTKNTSTRRYLATARRLP